MPIRIFENINHRFEEVRAGIGLERSNGFWQSLEIADFDKDGDMDLVVGNLGTNTKFKKEGSPLKMYVKDFDGNKTLDQILAYQLEGKWYPVATKDELGKQMPFMNKRFNSYKSFAGKTLEEVFDNGELEGAKTLLVNQFQSIYLENLGNGQFKQHALPEEAQVSKVFAFHIQDVDNDNHLDIIMGGNFYGSSMYQGRYDASYGLILLGDGKGSFQPVQNFDGGIVIGDEVRDIEKVKTGKGEFILVANNNGPIQIFQKANTN